MKRIKVNNRSFFSGFGYVFLDLALYVTIMKPHFPRQKLKVVSVMVSENTNEAQDTLVLRTKLLYII